MQLIKNYVNKYEFNIENEIKDSQKLALTGTLTFKQLEYNNSGENIITGIELQNEILICNKKDDKQLGKINISMVGIFGFDEKITKKDVEKVLLTEGVENLYKQMRTYINVNTTLSGMPSITLPILKFEKNKL